MKELQYFFSDIKLDLEEIKKELRLINGRIRENEKEIVKIKTVGGVVIFIIGVLLSVLNIFKIS